MNKHFLKVLPKKYFCKLCCQKGITSIYYYYIHQLIEVANPYITIYFHDTHCSNSFLEQSSFKISMFPYIRSYQNDMIRNELIS